MLFVHKLRLIGLILIVVAAIMTIQGFIMFSYLYCLPISQFCGQPLYLPGFLLFSVGAAITMAAARMLLSPAQGTPPLEGERPRVSFDTSFSKKFKIYFHMQPLFVGLFLIIAGASLLLLRTPGIQAELYPAMTATWVGLALASMELTNGLERWADHRGK